MRTWGRIATVCCALCAAPAGVYGQSLADYDYENLTFRGIGFDYGYIRPSRVEPAQLWSVRLDLGYLGPAIRISPSISYWSSRLRTTELDRFADRLNRLPALQEQGVELRAADLGLIDWSDLSISVDAHLVWTIPLDIITFIGAGASLHALNGRGEMVDNTFVEDLLDSTTAGIAVLGGFEIQPHPRLRLYGEGRYTLASDVRYPGLRIGTALMLPTRDRTHPPRGGR